ncbi:MAG: DUF2808 domain-containing protein [Leptolyngbyaceae cyanobacterium HOT.MB2.61]|jgi:hypothetical protein|nr:DUF2808 domain-containing protein [Leptolyngbyaceae cyanobacterium HOT.MB2.61]
MKINWSRLVAALAVSVSTFGVVNIPGQAVQLSDGTVAFTGAPRLEGASASQSAAYFWGSWYSFTITLPENAGEPLQKVAISQEDNVSYAHFDLRKTEAYEGTRRRSGRRLPIQDVTLDPNKRLITVLFDPPVSPGKTITIELYADRNPYAGGVYLYGVTAFPAGEKARGQFLGFGRIHIYDSYDTIFFRGPFRRWH